MAVVRKKVLSVGNWHGITGPAEVTPERIDHWIDQFNTLKAEGIKFPVPWGHQPTALPEDPRLSDSLAFGRSRFNAGYIQALSKDPADGALVAALDCPGVELEGEQLVSVAKLPDSQTPVKTVIDETSPAFGGTWTDGLGRTWEDVFAHVALVTMPAQNGQAGFAALATCLPSGFTCLATKVVRDKADDGLADDLVDAAADDEEPTDPMAPPEVDADGSTTGGASSTVGELIGLLAQAGVTLPGDTTDETFTDNLRAALTALIANKQQADAMAQKQNPDDQTLSKPRVREEPGPAPVGMLTTGAFAAQGFSANTFAGNTVLGVKSAPQSMLATIRSQYPAVAKLLQNEHERRRADRVDRIEKLKARGLPVQKANELMAVAAQTKLALLPSGDIQEPEIDRQIALLESVLPPADSPQSLLAAPNRVRELPNPAEPDVAEVVDGHPVTKAQAAVIAANVRDTVGTRKNGQSR